MTTLKVLLNPLFAALPLPGQTMLLSALLITLMTYVIMPRMTRLFAGWLVSSDAELRHEEKVAIAERLGDVRGCLSA